MTRAQAAHYATITSSGTTHAPDAFGQMHYFITSPLCSVRGTVAEPLHDYVVRRTFGGRHGVATRITNVLWTKLYEFLLELNLPTYSTAHDDNEYQFFRKLSLARLSYDLSRLQRCSDQCSTERRHDDPE